MIDIRIAIHHLQNSQQLTYHQNYDGGEYTIKHTESMSIYVDKIEVLDYNTLSVLDTYQRVHNNSGIDEDVSWFEVCNNNNDYNRYDNEAQSAELLEKIDREKYKFFFLTEENTNKLEQLLSSFACPSVYYKKVFFSAIKKCDDFFEEQIKICRKEIDNLETQLSEFKTNIEKRRIMLSQDIDTLLKDKTAKHYEIFKKALMNEKFSNNQIIPEYNQYPIELSISQDDIELFDFLIKDVDNLFCLTDRFFSKVETLFGIEIENRQLESICKHNNTIIQECCRYILLKKKDINTLALFVKKILSHIECINKYAPNIYDDLQVISFFIEMKSNDIEHIITQLSRIFHENNYHVSKRFILLIKYFLRDSNERKTLDLELKNSGIYYFVKTFEDCSLLFDGISYDSKNVVSALISTMYSDDDSLFVDLELPSGTKWCKRSFGYLRPYYKDSSSMLSDKIWKKNFNINSGNIISLSFGNNWQIPEAEDFKELQKYCVWTWKKGGYLQNGNYELSGYEIVGKNGQSIFLRGIGYKDEVGNTQGFKDGFYWTSTIVNSKEDELIAFVFDGLGKYTDLIPVNADNNLLIVPVKRKPEVPSFR